MLLPN
jgi:hypothetical protein